jgi:hypothetical protein
LPEGAVIAERKEIQSSSDSATILQPESTSSSETNLQQEISDDRLTNESSESDFTGFFCHQCEVSTIFC